MNGIILQLKYEILKQFKNAEKKKNKENPIFSIYDPLGVKLLIRLRLQFSHLNNINLAWFWKYNKRYVCMQN